MGAGLQGRDWRQGASAPARADVVFARTARSAEWARRAARRRASWRSALVVFVGVEGRPSARCCSPTRLRADTPRRDPRAAASAGVKRIVDGDRRSRRRARRRSGPRSISTPCWPTASRPTRSRRCRRREAAAIPRSWSATASTTHPPLPPPTSASPWARAAPARRRRRRTWSS